MEKTLFYQFAELIKDLKRDNKKTIKVDELSKKFEEFIKDKLTVDVQLTGEVVKFEGMTQTQSDTMNKIFESYVREFEQKQKQSQSNNGFELVANWEEDSVKTDKKVKEKKAKKKESVVKFRGKVAVTPPLNKETSK